MKLKLQELLNKYNLEINNIAQFGAHNGQEIEIFKNISNDKIYLFEPQLNAFNKLVDKTVDFEEIIVHNVGLGSYKSEKFLFVDVENEGQSASIYKPKIHLDIFPGISFENKEKINIETFDAFNLEVDLICLDIQGAELDALIGSKNSLKFTKCLVVEVSREELYENQPSVYEIDAFLINNNFVRVSTKWAESGKFLYGDAFYINKDFISIFNVKLSLLKNYIFDKKSIAKIKYFISRIKYKMR